MTTEAAPIRLLLVDDHRMFRQGLREILERRPGLVVVGEAGTGQAALELAERLRPDVVLMDIQMPDLDGVSATRALMARWPDLKVVVLTMYRADEHLLAAIRAGAKGYLLKDADAEELVGVIERVHRGESVLDAAGTARLFEAVRRMGAPTPGPEPLTERELEILSLVAEGHDNRTIAARLYLSEKTVANRLSEIFEKLGVSNRTQAAIVAHQRYLPRG